MVLILHRQTAKEDFSVYYQFTILDKRYTNFTSMSYSTWIAGAKTIKI